MEVYICWIEITNSLMWTLIVPIMNELSMSWKHPRLADIRLMERLNLTNRRRSPHARDDMFDSVSTAELCKLRPTTSSRIELRSPIRQDLVRLTEQPNGFFQKPNRMLRCRVVMNH